MNNEHKIDFESKDFWKTTIKKAVAKRLIKRNRIYPELIQEVCKLDENEIDRLLKLNSSYIRRYDEMQREKYLSYYTAYKFEDWECKKIIDLNEKDIFEICEGKGQPCQLDFENLLESELIEAGMKIAKNLALIKMTDLNYKNEDINEILGDTKTEYIFKNSFFINHNVMTKMETHFINLGIRSKRMDILIELFKFENNPKNASAITGLTLSELEKIIEDNMLFKSESTIIDKDKLGDEMKLVDFEILIEAIVIHGMYEDQINDYSKLSGLNCEIIKRIYELNKEFRAELCEFLNECTFKLMERGFEYYEIEEITATDIYGSENDEYYYENFKKHLSKEVF